MRASPRLALALLGVAFAPCGLGCEPPGVADAGPRDAALECLDDGRLEVGAGGARARALAESGGELEIVLGAQGGIHVVVASWLRDVPLDLEVTYLLVSIDSDTVLAETVVALRPSLLRPELPRYLRHPDLLVLDNDAPSVERFDGRSASLELHADVGSERLCDRRSVVLRAPAE